MIKEHDHVIRTSDLPSLSLRADDIGTAVPVHGNDEAFEVEFVSMDGETLALETLKPAHVRRGDHGILHARNID